jgi:hypothetical protein
MISPAPRDVLRSISMLYRTMFLALITFVVITAIMTGDVDQPGSHPSSTEQLLKTIMYLMVIVIIPVSFMYPQRLIARIDPSLHLSGKLLAYRQAIFIRFSALTTAGVLIALGFLLLKDSSFMVIQAIVLVAFIIFKPTSFKIAADLQLNDKEKQQLL